jgi:hypothetical protein
MIDSVRREWAALSSTAMHRMDQGDGDSLSYDVVHEGLLLLLLLL